MTKIQKDLREWARKQKGSVVRACPFENDDVPKFLEKLRIFEAWSRKNINNIMVG